MIDDLSPVDVESLPDLPTLPSLVPELPELPGAMSLSALHERDRQLPPWRAIQRSV